MTIQECERREQIYKKLLEKFHPAITFDSKDCTPEELECIHYPPSATDGKPCCFCETTDPLLNCYQRKDDDIDDEP